jgi:uncharacterized protein YbaP (TraB family)
MKSLLAAALFLCALTQPALAQPAMWEVRDADSGIWLFGSSHLLPAALDWRTPAFDDAVAASEHVYFETDIGPRGLAALTVKMVFATMRAATDSWLDLLSDDEAALLAAAVAPLGLGVEDATRLPPWLVAMQISQQRMLAEAETAPGDYDFTTGVEWGLQWELPPERKAYLETPGEQFDMLAAGTIAEQIDQLLAMLAQPTEGDVLGELITAWSSGDLDGIARLMTPKSDHEAAAIEALLLQRNRNWLAPLEQLLAQNRQNLVIVGAAHLVGDGSVLDLLAEAGYTVTRIQ